MRFDWRQPFQTQDLQHCFSSTLNCVLFCCIHLAFRSWLSDFVNLLFRIFPLLRHLVILQRSSQDFLQLFHLCQLHQNVRNKTSHYRNWSGCMDAENLTFSKPCLVRQSCPNCRKVSTIVLCSWNTFVNLQNHIWRVDKAWHPCRMHTSNLLKVWRISWRKWGSNSINVYIEEIGRVEGCHHMPTNEKPGLSAWSGTVSTSPS